MGQESIQLAADFHEYAQAASVSFDSKNVVLEGCYADQLSAYRAKRAWSSAVETSFLLDTDLDFVLKIESHPTDCKFVLRCEFLTACGRYAFWRLTNNQAPEAQYLIETGHIPPSAGHADELMAAPDLRSNSEPLVLRGPRLISAHKSRISAAIEKLLVAIGRK